MIQDAYDVFITTLANRNRLQIITALQKKERNVTAIARQTGINQTTVSHGLQRLHACGFVTVEQRGKHRYYKLNKETIQPLMNLIDVHIKNHCLTI